MSRRPIVFYLVSLRVCGYGTLWLMQPLHGDDVALKHMMLLDIGMAGAVKDSMARILICIAARLH